MGSLVIVPSDTPPLLTEKLSIQIAIAVDGESFEAYLEILTHDSKLGKAALAMGMQVEGVSIDH